MVNRRLIANFELKTVQEIGKKSLLADVYYFLTAYFLSVMIFLFRKMQAEIPGTVPRNAGKNIKNS